MKIELKENVFGLKSIENAYGMYITINNELETVIKDTLQNSDAKNKIEVAVKYNEEVRTYTLDNFLKTLGFRQ